VIVEVLEFYRRRGGRQGFDPPKMTCGEKGGVSHPPEDSSQRFHLSRLRSQADQSYSSSDCARKRANRIHSHTCRSTQITDRVEGGMDCCWSEDSEATFQPAAQDGLRGE